MTILREEHYGQRLIQVSQFAVAASLGRFDAVVTDPPMGSGVTARSRRQAGTGQSSLRLQGLGRRTPPPEVFKRILSLCDEPDHLGGNYFADLLPPVDA